MVKESSLGIARVGGEEQRMTVIKMSFFMGRSKYSELVVMDWHTRWNLAIEVADFML